MPYKYGCQHPDPEIIPLLVERLSDPVAEVRGEAAAQLLELAQASRASVVEAVTPLFVGHGLDGHGASLSHRRYLAASGCHETGWTSLETSFARHQCYSRLGVRRLSTKESHAEQVMKKAVAWRRP